MHRIILAFAVLVTVCTTAHAQCAATRVPVRVYLMYGLVSGVLSSGMADLARKMNGIKNVTASVHEWGEASFIAARASAEKSAIVIGGHSIGANSAVSAARMTKKRVAVLLAFDPSSMGPIEAVPPNVSSALLFTQQGNPFGGGALPSGGRPVSRYNDNLGHVEIDKFPKYHAIAMSAVCGIGGTN